MRPQVETLRNLPDFGTRFRWNLFFVTFPPAVTSAITEDLNLRCISATLPKKRGSNFDVTIRGWDIPNPGIWKVAGTIKLVFIETIDNKILDFFSQWHEAVWSMSTGTGANKADLTALVELDRLDRQDNTIREYQMYVFPEDYENGGDLDEKGLEILPALTLAYADFTEIGATTAFTP